MSDIDRHNERLIKEVREEMRALGTTNPSGKPMPEYSYEPPFTEHFRPLSTFILRPTRSFRSIPVPVRSTIARQTARHRSCVRRWVGKRLADGDVLTNDNNVRVGYAQSGSFSDKINAPQLSFDYTATTTTRGCELTDDPVATYQIMATLPSGTPVIYLSEYVNEYRWAYVEVSQGGTMMRGFIPADAIVIQQPVTEDLPEIVDITF